MKKIMLLLLSLSLFLACNKESEKITLVLDWAVNTNHTGLYVALEKGYYAQEGIEVAIEFPPETGGSSLLLSGTAQFAVSYQEEITFARMGGTPLKALAAIIQHNSSGFAARATAGIKDFKDFEAKRYGGWGSPVEDAVLKALMKRSGGDFNKIELIPIGSMDFFAATQQGIDFVWIFQGWDGIAAGLKNIPINYFPLREIDRALDYYTPVIAATDSFIEKNPAKVKAFLKAVSKGYEFSESHPKEAGEILLKYAPELDRELVLASQEFLAKEYKADAPKWGVMKQEVWENFAKWLSSYGLLEGEFKASDAYTNAFLP